MLDYDCEADCDMIMYVYIVMWVESADTRKRLGANIRDIFLFIQATKVNAAITRLLG